MKSFIAVAVVAVFVAYGAPVAKAAVDWYAVEGKANEIESAVQAAIQQVNTIAQRENATIGADIERKLGAMAVKARAVLDQVRAAIAARSVTAYQAREHFSNLYQIIASARKDIRIYLAKLSVAAKARIRDIFSQNLSEVEKLANDIYALLRQ